MIVVYGAAGSGKSEVAENIITSLAQENDGRLFYLATMESESEAAKKRIKRHLKLREGKGFTTIEEPYDLTKCADIVKGQYVLVEDVSNLFANVYFSSRNNNIKEQFEKLCDFAKEVVVVANNIFEEGKSEDEICDGYLNSLAKVNIELVDMSDTFVEVICGNTILRKGENSWQ